MIFSSDALDRINQALSTPMSTWTFNKKLYPLMVEQGIATPSTRGQRGIITNEAYFSHWCVYLATREVLVEQGIWKPKRAYSIGDMESIAVGGEYEDYQPN